MQVVLFLLVVSLIAGLVAAGGDWMGHRAARRKIRFGKMRPRYVSTLIAVVTGVVISLATFGIVLAVWKDAREALTSYAEVKKDLVLSQSELSKMVRSLADAQEKVDAAQSQFNEAESQAEELNAQLTIIRGQIIELIIDIDQKNLELEKLNTAIERKEKERDQLLAEIEQLNREKTSAEFRVNSLLGLKDRLGAEIEGLEQEVASLLEGEIVISRGTNLAYEKVAAEDVSDLRNKLQRAINSVVVSLAKRELAIDLQSEGLAEEFIATYPYNEDAVVIISAAQNVVEGHDVLLAFDARSLKPLVKPGEIVCEVLVKSSSASISTFGTGSARVGIPARLDEDGLAKLESAIQSELAAGADTIGFLPDLRSGQVSSPVAKLAKIADELSKRERPYIVRFVANEALNALDGLENCSIQVIDAN